MKARLAPATKVPRTREIAAELDQLFQRQLELLRRESFVGFTKAEREEWERVGVKIRGLFEELAKMS